MTELQPLDLLHMAAGLTIAQIDKMAHALGWPDTRATRILRSRVRWSNPYRNHYFTSELDQDWLAAEREGLAVSKERLQFATGVYWTVTDLGRSVLMLRLMAQQEVIRD